DARFKTNPGRVEHRDDLVPLLEQLLRLRTTGEWVSLLEEIGVPHAPLCTYADLLDQPQAVARGYRITVRDASGHPLDLIVSPVHLSGEVGRREATYPPAIGEHTDPVLSELCGLSPTELADLRASGVIG